MYSSTFRIRLDAVMDVFECDGDVLLKDRELMVLRSDIERQIIMDKEVGRSVVVLLDLFEVVCDMKG